MGWLEGVLTGYADRHFEIQKQKRAEAELAAQREQQVLSTLLESKYPDVADAAAAGVLDLANPRRRSGGVAGWMGEIDKSPYLPMIQRTRQRIAEDPEYARTQLDLGRYGPSTGLPTPSIPTPAGSVPNQPSAALPETSLVEGGTGTAPTPAPTPPPAPPGVTGTMGPTPSFAGRSTQNVGRPPASFAPGTQAGTPPPSASFMPPPTPPGVQAAQADGAAPPQAGPPMAPATPGQGTPGGAVGTVGRVPPLRSSRTALPGIFPTAADRQQDQTRAQVTGKIDAYTEMYMAQGLPEQEAYRKAAELLERDLVGSGANPYISIRGEYTDPVTKQLVRGPISFDKATNRYLLPNGQPAPPDLRLVTTGRLSQSVETAAKEFGYPSATAVPQGVFPAILQRAQEIDADVTQNRTEAVAAGKVEGPLSPEYTSQHGLPLGTEGRQIINQTVPTPEQRQRRVAISGIKTIVEQIRTAVPRALVSEQEIAGLAPNVANTIMAGTTRRKEFADLQTNVESVVNTLARAIQEQRGAQTEQDAVRAYNTLVAFQNTIKGMLTDPFGGDTIESADRRLAITLAFLELSLSRIPPEPVVQAKPGAGGGSPSAAAAPQTPGAGGTPAPAAIPQKGFYKDPVTGKRYLNGKEY